MFFFCLLMNVGLASVCEEFFYNLAGWIEAANLLMKQLVCLFWTSLQFVHIPNERLIDTKAIHNQKLFHIHLTCMKH